MHLTLKALLFLSLICITLAERIDLECLTSFVADENARDALSELLDLRLDEIQLDETDGLFNFESLLISEKIKCQARQSAFCGEVQTIPPQDELDRAIQQIMDEVNQMSDEELLDLLDYDVNGLCLRVNDIDVALQPHYDCLNRNIKAFSELNPIAQELTKVTLNRLGFDIESLSSDLVNSLIEGCDSLKSSLASSLRSQLTSEFWHDAVNSIVSGFDLDSFEAIVENSQKTDYKTILGCTIPDELVCAKYVSSFASSCILLSRRELSFNEAQWKSVHFEVFQTLSHKYPCDDTFQDDCMGTYLFGKPNLNLVEDCSSVQYYYSLSDEEVPTSAPTQAPTEAPTEETPTEAPTEAPTETPVDEPSIEPTEAPSNTPADSGGSLNPKKGLSGGLIALIILVVVAVVLVIAFIGYLYKKKRIPMIQREYQIRL